MKAQSEPRIEPLTEADAGELSILLEGARPGYRAHFHPFAFDEESVRRELRNARRDRYWSVRVDGALAGFFMLRGFDAGYERPAFGVFIAERYAGRGLARRALAEAAGWCEENQVREMMLTVHAENAAAVRIYEEAGFVVAQREASRILMSKRLRA